SIAADFRLRLGRGALGHGSAEHRSRPAARPGLAGFGLLPPTYFARAARPRTSAAQRSKTSLQSPARCWRKRRIVGYQGLSVRSRSQRQSGTLDSKTHTRTPSAPAKWARAVSEV